MSNKQYKLQTSFGNVGYKAVLFGVVFGLVLFIFRIQDSVFFRDFLTANRVYEPSNSIVSPFFILQRLQNFLYINFELPNYILVSIVFSLLITISLFANHFSFQKLLNSENKQRFLLNLVVVCLYTFNPFALERVLMGQYFIYFGYLFMPWAVYQMLNLSGLDTTRFYWKKYLLATVSVCFVFYWSVHFGLITLGFSLLYLVLKRKSVLPVWKNVIKSEFFYAWVTSSLFFILILFNNYFVSSQFQTYVGGQLNRSGVIELSSLRPLQGENLIVRGLIGSASWMGSFNEVYKIQADLDWLTFFSLYSNPVLGWLFVIALGVLIYLAVSYIPTIQDKPLIATSLISFFLSSLLMFGYSYPFFRVFNQVFYFLPGSYIFREAGKFYGLFFFMVLILALEIYKYIDFKKSFAAVLILLSISNFIPFLVLSNNLNYAQEPETWELISQTCGESENFLYLPLNTYQRTFYSPKVFGYATPRRRVKCQMLELELATIVSADRAKEYTLSKTESAAQLENLLLDIDNNYSDFIEYLVEKQIDYLVIETFEDAQMQTLNNLLANDYEPIFVEQTMFSYQIKSSTD